MGFQGSAHPNQKEDSLIEQEDRFYFMCPSFQDAEISGFTSTQQSDLDFMWGADST